MPEVYVKFNSLEEAMQALQGGAPVAPAVPAPAFVPPQPQAPAPFAAAPAYVPPAPVAAAPVAPAPVAAGGAITSAQVAAQAQAYAKAHGPKAAKAVFAEFGAGAVAQIAPEHYAAVMQRMAV